MALWCCGWLIAIVLGHSSVFPFDLNTTPTGVAHLPLLLLVLDMIFGFSPPPTPMQCQLETLYFYSLSFLCHVVVLLLALAGIAVFFFRTPFPILSSHALNPDFHSFVAPFFLLICYNKESQDPLPLLQ